MLPCNQCKRESSIETALLTQDFYAAPLVFCSIDCYDGWLDKVLAPVETPELRPEYRTGADRGDPTLTGA